MNLKVFPLTISFLSVITGSTNFQEIEEPYKVTDSIWIKNLYFYDGKEKGFEPGSKVINFDIIFHSTIIKENIEGHIRETENNTIKPALYEPESRLGMAYQDVQLILDPSFVSRISKNETLKVKYGDLILFAFQCPELLNPVNAFVYQRIEDLPEDMVFKYEVKLPRIYKGEFHYSYFETVDLSKIDFRAMQNYYYGKFPDEYLWVGFHTELYDASQTMEKLCSVGSRYNLYANAFFYEINLFKKYHSFDSSLIDKPFFDSFIFKNRVNGYYHLDYWNKNDRVTFKDGTMRIKSELSEDELIKKENKTSDYITYPLDEEWFDYYFDMAKNMEISIEISTGIFENFMFRLNYENNLEKDYFYNHLHESSITGTHNNGDLLTVDRMYA